MKGKVGDWVNAWAALGTVANRLSLFIGPGGANVTAMSVLQNAIVSGEIAARSGGQNQVSAGETWRQLCTPQDELLPFRDIEIQRTTLDAWLTKQVRRNESNKVGAKPTHNWNACEMFVRAEMAARVPAKQVEIERLMTQWFDQQGRAQPSPRTIRKKAAPLYRSLTGRA
ncbi:hypothetical protein [Bradyrhizobium sp.]|uniref:hypothetical protein n=1 Tax=Bradyrhizobium sp. TaxID=376 RepID=UPI0007C8AEE5|nr:hypothetical protein [Bradyrhizobium sp.]